jgi:hypothetical protein
MRELDSDQDAQLAALNEINHSLRQQVIELVLSIAAMRENADLLSGISCGVRTANCGPAKMTSSFGFGQVRECHENARAEAKLAKVESTRS